MDAISVVIAMARMNVWLGVLSFVLDLQRKRSSNVIPVQFPTNNTTLMIAIKIDTHPGINLCSVITVVKFNELFFITYSYTTATLKFEFLLQY